MSQNLFFLHHSISEWTQLFNFGSHVHFNLLHTTDSGIGISSEEECRRRQASFPIWGERTHDVVNFAVEDRNEKWMIGFEFETKMMKKLDPFFVSAKAMCTSSSSFSLTGNKTWEFVLFLCYHSQSVRKLQPEDATHFFCQLKKEAKAKEAKLAAEAEELSDIAVDIPPVPPEIQVDGLAEKDELEAQLKLQREAQGKAEETEESEGERDLIVQHITPRAICWSMHCFLLLSLQQRNVMLSCFVKRFARHVTLSVFSCETIRASQTSNRVLQMSRVKTMKATLPNKRKKTLKKNQRWRAKSRKESENFSWSIWRNLLNSGSSSWIPWNPVKVGWTRLSRFPSCWTLSGRNFHIFVAGKVCSQINFFQDLIFKQPHECPCAALVIFTHNLWNTSIFVES